MLLICHYGVPYELILDKGVHFRADVDTLNILSLGVQSYFFSLDIQSHLP